ncbi:hypothetical protein Hypma_003251 [Hypsizygus marmoreus]|uniref:Uncharacterized protein n=1 Tax=Hypsizygus marmoreus TaxID=39966 RepID=A0A369JZA1_HYPMA|nr:hypothetical protein Hypma_003251 [Hypsizygus marmoreus]
MNSIHATVPSENWDDDFEFQQKTTTTKKPENAHDHVEHRISIASSDWDHDDESTRAAPPISTILEDKKNIFNSEWIEPGPSTPSKRHTHARSTENWDDDFEDSPVRKGFPSPPQKEKSSPKASRLRRGPLTNAPRPESWDEEFDTAPSHASSPASSPGKRPRYTSAYSSSEDEGAMEHEHDDELDFGFHERDEEDRTVTARSRRAALSRLSTGPSHSTPPPPVPALPLPFLLNPSTSTAQPHPFPRSPTSSVFSVPTTTRPPSSSAYTVTSTTHLRPTVSRSSSGLGALPPSPPIHRERERRRLRKKSRPQGAGVIELGPLRSREREENETGDEYEQGDQDVVMRPHTPPPASAPQPPSGSSTPASGSGGGGAGALLSRIGSVKKWGVRRKRGSTTPGEVAALGKLDTDPTNRCNETDNNLTPRPHSQASMSSVPSSSESSNAHSQLPKNKRRSMGSPQANGNGTGNNWFFRSGSSSSNSNNHSHTHSPLGTSGQNTPTKLRVASASVLGEGEPSPSKLVKRKSLGFVQLRRGFGGNAGGGGGEERDRERERESQAQGKRRSSSQTPGTPKKYGGLGLGRSTGVENGADEEQEGGESEDMDVEGHHERERSDEKEKEGARGFMGSVRRISLVGRHKRTKSGVSLSNVAEGTFPVFHPHSHSHNPVPPTTPQKPHHHHRLHPPPSTSNAATPTPATPAGSSQSHPLLPPIELQPPSPPRVRPHVNTVSSEVQSSTSMPLESMLSPSTSSSSSQTPSPLSPSHSVSSMRRPKAPGSPQAASLGRSTIGPGNASTVGGSPAGGGSGTGSVSGVHSSNTGGTSTPVLRRNSLGDLKIPDRITQAQVALRRDLVMVKEFAANVEQLKELQMTYHELVVEVQSILDMHAHQHAQQQQHQQPQSRATSPSFFSHISRPMSRNRSNTNPSSSPPTSNSNNSIPLTSTPFSSIPIPMHPNPQLAYKQLASAFYTINSKYRISWECAELLIELGNGSGSSKVASSTSAPAIQSSGPDGARKISGSGRERAVTLAGDESKPPTPTPGVMGSTGSVRGPSPPIASPPSTSSWRASTGRHDLNTRQLGLLREMLNHGDSMSTFVSEEFHHPHHFGAVGGAGMSGSIPEESAFPALLNVNRDWRWGDAMSSTVTLPSEESGPGAGGDEGFAKKKKRRSSRLGMTGLRDMLRSLKRSHSENHTPVPQIPASSTSLSTEDSSLDSHRYPHGHVPPTTGRRRAKTSSGPESLRLGRPTSPYSPSSLTSKPSPRRPSLASIFRLGQKNKPLSPTLTSDLPSDLQTNLTAPPGSAGSHSTSGRESSSNGEEEEDWDQVESASDLDAAARALGIGHDGSATVRGKGRSPYMQIPGRPLTPKRSASGSQSSIWGGDPNGGTSPPPLPPHTRATRLSNVEEHVDDGRQGRPSSKGSQYRTGASPSSTRVYSPKIPKSGSVRSMPPQPMAMPDPKLAMLPENIKPLLENSIEVHARLNECIAEIQALLTTYLHPA